jgi:hypothetical protein
MKLGLHIPATDWQGGAEQLGATLADVVQAGEAAGFDTIDVEKTVPFGSTSGRTARRPARWSGSCAGWPRWARRP